MLTTAQRKELGALARHYNLPEAHVLAIVHVESGGQVFSTIEGKQLPLVLPEPHVFYRRLKGAQRDDAVAEKLASPTWNPKLYPGSQEGRWRMLARMSQINAQAALESTSVGVGQVLGMHWQSLGFTSVEQLFSHAKKGLTEQADIMLRYVRANGLEDELRQGQWAPFARGYNGPAYAKNRYDVKMREAAAMYGGSDVPANGMLRMGAKGARVRELQALLIRAGYAIKVDNDFGPSTKLALQEFQRANKLEPDGIYGPATERALGSFRQAASDQPGKVKALDIPLVRAGGVATIVAGLTPEAVATAKGALEGAAAQIVGAGVQSVVMDYLVQGLQVGAALLGVAGMAVAFYGWVKSGQTKEA